MNKADSRRQITDDGYHHPGGLEVENNFICDTSVRRADLKHMAHDVTGCEFGGCFK